MNPELSDGETQRADYSAINRRTLPMTPIAQAQTRRPVRVSGEVVAVTYPSEGGRRELRVHLRDDTATIMLVWQGRDAIPGIAPGQWLEARGMILETAGRRRLINPAYDLLTPTQKGIDR